MSENSVDTLKKPNFGRRRVPRRPIDLRVGLLVKGEYFLSLAYEIGEGGMLISSPRDLIEGQKVVVTFNRPDIVSASVLSHVVYLQSKQETGTRRRYGLQFEQIDFEVKRKIRNFVASNAGEYKIAEQN